MKGISKYLLLTITAVIALSGCSSLLDKTDPTGLADIYDTPEKLENAAEGVLAGFLGTYGVNGETVLWFTVPSGLTHWGRTTSPLTYQQYLSMLKFTHYSTTVYNENYFNRAYQPVHYANNLLSALPSSPVEEALKKEIEAEARFYRAVAYFNIVRIWGDCPLRLDAADEKSASNCPRTPWYQVYCTIVKELEFCEKNMRSPERVKVLFPGTPHVNKYAATAYLSSVYTQIASLLAHPTDNFWNPDKPGRSPDLSSIGVADAAAAYRKALEYAEKLIPESAAHDSGCDYSLLEKFTDNFTWDRDFSRNGYTSFLNPEQVFTIPITVSAGGSTQYARYVLPQYPEGTACDIANTNNGRVRPTRFFFQKWCGTYPVDPVATLHKGSADPRLDATFYYNELRYCNDPDQVLSIYPAVLRTGYQQSYPYFKKCVSKLYNVNFSDSDFCMMRLAEVYFNAIEAAAYLEDEGKARGYMEIIHKRARHSVADGKPDSEQPTWDGVFFSDREDMMTRVFWERMFEFSGENQELFHTHRFGATWIVDNICKPKNEFLALPEQAHLMGTYYPEGFSYSTDPQEVRKGLLITFPANEILYNSGIPADAQNDYWYGL